MKTFLVLAVLLCICYVGCNIFPTYTKEEAKTLVRCASKYPAALEEFVNCPGPNVMLLVRKYCIIETYPTARNLTEAFEQGASNPCLVAKVYDCINKNIHCISYKDKYEGVAEHEKCLRGIVCKYCPSERKFTIKIQVGTENKYANSSDCHCLCNE